MKSDSSTYHIVFRFHDRFHLIAERIDRLRRLNDGLKITGFYGGPKSNLSAARKLDWNDFYPLRDKIDLWKWQYADLHLRKWYKKHGQHLDFSYVCLLEWDLIFTKPLCDVYPDTQADLLTTGIKKIEERRNEGWPWLVEPYLAPEREKFEHWARTKLRWSGEAKIGLLPGARISRRFLEAYSRLRPPRGGNDELRLAILADALKLKHDDTGFGNTTDFNCDRREITPQHISVASRDPGRYTFHPVYQSIDLSKS